MHEWEEISFDEVAGLGVFKFTYYNSDGTGNGNAPWAVCMENEDMDYTFAEDLLIELKQRKDIIDLQAWKSIAEYE